MVETSISVSGYEVGISVEGEQGENILLNTSQGQIHSLVCWAPNAKAAVLWAGSWRGEGPGQSSSPIARAVAQDLYRDGITSLLLR